MKYIQSTFLHCILSVGILTTFLFYSCSGSSSTTTAIPIDGGGVDKHGCISSAGYQWSSVQQECIRAFELPLILVNEGFNAGITFSDDQKLAEVFTKDGTFVLKLQSENNYALGKYYSLVKKNTQWEFEDKKHQVIYN